MALVARQQDRPKYRGEHRGGANGKVATEGDVLRGQHPVQDVAREHRSERADQECRIGRAPEHLHAGEIVVGCLEERRIAPERIQHHEQEEQRQRADRPVPEPAARQSGGDEQQHRQRADIDLSHVLRERQILHPVGIEIGPPEINLRALRAEQVADEGRQERGWMQRAAGRDAEADFRAGRRLREKPCPEQRHGDDREAGQARQGDRHERGAQGDPAAREPVRHHHPDQHIAAEHRDLVRFQHHQPGGQPGADARPGRIALQHPRRQPEGNGEEGQALDLPDMLYAPGGGGAESEDQRRQQPARGVPAAIPEEHENGEAGHQQMQQHERVHHAEARRR